jgi:hypothetical protein
MVCLSPRSSSPAATAASNRESKVKLQKSKISGCIAFSLFVWGKPLADGALYVEGQGLGL